jgi:hypothetical protein
MVEEVIAGVHNHLMKFKLIPKIKIHGVPKIIILIQMINPIMELTKIVGVTIIIIRILMINKKMEIMVRAINLEKK